MNGHTDGTFFINTSKIPYKRSSTTNTKYGGTCTDENRTIG